jgi:hypothetical protein
MPKTHKLYCYVDETGQDTKGSYFIVAVVVTDNSQHELEHQLGAVEAASGKKTAKWLKTSDKSRQAYVQALLESQALPAMIYAKRFTDGKGGFDELEVLATAQALNVYREEQGIGESDYKVTVTVDGLSKTMAKKMGSEFRKLGIKTRKVVGKKDESSAIIRLADAIAGLEREVHEGRSVYKIMRAALLRTRRLYEL